MSTCDLPTLLQKTCVPCEGGVPRLTSDEASRALQVIDGWSLNADGTRIVKTWTVKHFRDGMAFFQRIAWVAEQEGHHPDLHLEGFRQVRVELWTHAIGGLSENDFILAAKIDALPVEIRQPS